MPYKSAAENRLPPPQPPPPSPPPPRRQCCREAQVSGTWKRLLFAGLQYALGFLTALATLAITMDTAAWIHVTCGQPTLHNATQSLTAGSQGLWVHPDWASLAVCCEKFDSAKAEAPVWTAVSWLLVVACVASCGALVVLILGSLSGRPLSLARLLTVSYLTLAPLTAALLCSVIAAGAVSARRIQRLKLECASGVAALSVSGSAFPAQLAAATAAAVAAVLSAAALPLRRALLTSRSYDVTSAAALSEVDTGEVAESVADTEADVNADADARRSSKSASSAYQAAESVDDCVSEVAGDEVPACAVPGCYDNFRVTADDRRLRPGFVDRRRDSVG